MPAVLYPTGQFNDPTSGLPISLGKVYIGNVDEDPTVLGNRINVTIIQEDGTPVVIAPAAQPFILNAGGQFSYLGSVVQLRTNQNFSMTVLDMNDVEEYYFPSVVAGESIVADNLSLAAGGTPSPIAGEGQLYTKIFEGTAELYYMDSDGRELRMTYKGELAVNLSATDLTVGSLRTLTFVRGHSVAVPVEDGVATIDWQAATLYTLAITGTTTIDLINMPNADADEAQVIALDIEMTGTQTVILDSEYAVLRPSALPLTLTPDGRDYYICESHDGVNVIVSPLSDIIPQA